MMGGGSDEGGGGLVGDETEERGAVLVDGNGGFVGAVEGVVKCDEAVGGAGGERGAVGGEVGARNGFGVDAVYGGDLESGD